MRANKSIKEEREKTIREVERDWERSTQKTRGKIGKDNFCRVEEGSGGDILNDIDLYSKP